MSLQLLAKQMEAKGRKGDSMLVHMTPGEVAGLQKLAESMGGSLTVNPETGLVEANFLKKLISSPLFAPLAGAGLMMIPGVGPMMAAGLVGGGTALATGDVGKGAMAGLGAYGGAGLAGGLMGAGNAAASQAATAANPAVMGPMPGAASGFEAAKAGVSALGNEAGRSAFMQGVGGVGGLAKSAGMAAAPMLTQEQKMADAPVDDEMYYTEYNPGQTGKRSSTSTEALQFAGGYTPMESIKAEDYMKRRNRQFSAAQGGLMSLAEGGETAAPTAAEVAAPSASEAALAYLMGERSSSAPARSPFIDAQLMGASPKSNIGVGADNMYAFDPATGTFLRNPNVAGATSSAVRGPVGTSFASSGGDGYQPVGPNPDFDTPEKQAAFYAENPTMGAITRAGQTALGFLPGGSALFAAQEYMDPGFRQAQENITYGISAPPSPGAGYMGDNSLEMSGGGGGAGPSNQSYNFSGNDSMDFGSEAQGGPIGNQDFGGGFDYGGSYDSYSSDSNSGGGSGGTDAGMSNQGEGGSDSYGGWKAGGLMGLAKGGMASGGFVVPADVVSALGNGSTDAGLRKLSAMMGDVKPIKGKGDGLSDSIPTNIDGKQPARVADGEAYIDPKTVKRLGGAKKLYAMMDKVRAQAHGKTTQQRKVNPARVMA